jgi:hypothetical protein
LTAEGGRPDQVETQAEAEAAGPSPYRRRE